MVAVRKPSRGSSSVPRQILGTLTPDTDLAGMIFDRAGRPLWLGRKQRLANAAQRFAVAIRDGGCFECGAPMHRCELHHIQEWHRDGGRTNIENLVAVCRKHHRWLETENLVVIRTTNGYEARPRDGPAPWPEVGMEEQGTPGRISDSMTSSNGLDRNGTRRA